MVSLDALRETFLWRQNLKADSNICVDSCSMYCKENNLVEGFIVYFDKAQTTFIE